MIANGAERNAVICPLEVTSFKYVKSPDFEMKSGLLRFDKGLIRFKTKVCHSSKFAARGGKISYTCRFVAAPSGAAFRSASPATTDAASTHTGTADSAALPVSSSSRESSVKSLMLTPA